MGIHGKAMPQLAENSYQTLASKFQGKAGGGVSFLRDFNGLAQKPIRQKGNAEPKKMRRPPPLS